MIRRIKQKRFDISSLPRSLKRLIMITADFVLIPLSLWSAFALRLGDPFPDISKFWWLFIAAPILSIPVFVRLGLYRAIVRFMGAQVVMAVIQGATLSALLLATLTLLSGVQGVPRSIFIIYWGAMVLYVAGSRFMVRSYLHSLASNKNEKEGVIIYGAGNAGVQLATALISGQEFEPLAFVDDSRTFQGSVIHGIRVYAPDDLPALVRRLDITQVLLAMPSAGRNRRRAIVDSLESLPVHVLTIPGMADLVSGQAKVDEIREIDIEDLLGRDSVMPDEELLDACVKSKTVMVTGAGGSIGSELCRQIVRHEPEQLILFEQSEYALYRIDQELKSLVAKETQAQEIIALLGSVQDKERLTTIMEIFEVDTVYHAAAYKHVPLVEHNPIEGVRNNIFGTLCAANAAAETGVKDFVLISTDKAVRPTNTMGATKRLAELILQAMALEYDKTRFCMVRFGNVLGSSGSVVPLFREQIRNGGPVTVTHQDIIRYFMTIPEAAQLVIQAGSMANGGDVFVLDMGEPVKISDLAKKMIHLSGFEVKDDENPNGDIEIKYTGLRPGEKLYEELLIGENPIGTSHPRIMKAEEDYLPWKEIKIILEKLEVACVAMDMVTIKQILSECVHGYNPRNTIEDNVWKALNGNASGDNVEKLLH